ncbi:15789_t:CDS:1 [Dentiscutata erythropus]|uniref:15789_t:CDS:1 n=1 Tax=Dentiscutata erythropus TaxID=1348616 RepID=A0A9N9AQL7_9GLOM|nr:15789_t:CDS:1 [Dentiscutata erythropus]
MVSLKLLRRSIFITIILFLCLGVYYINKFHRENSIPIKNRFTSVISSIDLEKEQNQKFFKFNALYNNYIKKHDEAVKKLLKLKQSTVSNSTNLPKVVVVKPDMKTGIGNRFPGIVCGFLYSIITDRLLFIDGYKDFTDYFEKDFEHNWEKVANLYQNRSVKSLHSIKKNEFPLIARGNLSSEEVNSYDILRIHTWDYVCVPIMSNPNYKEWIKEIIPDYKIFTVISQKLLRLKFDINKQVENFITNNFGEYNIGIHLRVRKKTKKTNKMIIPIKHYSQVVEMLLMGIDKKNVTVFIAADTNESRNNLINYVHKSLDSDNKKFVKIVHINNDMSIENPYSHFNRGTEIGALIDMKILSFCDDLVLTYGSTFGYIAAGWSYRSLRRLGPFVVMPERKDEDNFSLDKIWLWQARSNEPCMYLGKVLMKTSDPKTVEVFKDNPFWMHYSQGCP